MAQAAEVTTAPEANRDRSRRDDSHLRVIPHQDAAMLLHGADGRAVHVRPCTPMLSDTQQAELSRRLRKIEGQVQGIQRMVAEPRLCIDILQQLAAVDAALDRVRVAIFRHHVSHCVPDAIRRGGHDKVRHIAELADIVDQFCK
jgi:DNA-binding FrmR family transcriptional regulator